MKYPTYKKAVLWIAQNDNLGDNESREVLQGYLTVTFVADLFEIPVEKVAKDVFEWRTLFRVGRQPFNELS